MVHIRYTWFWSFIFLCILAFRVLVLYDMRASVLLLKFLLDVLLLIFLLSFDVFHGLPLLMKGLRIVCNLLE